MSGTGESLLLPSRRWQHRGGEAARIWSLAVSLALHAALLFLAGDWFANQRLATIEAPFVVNLVVPEEAPAQEAPREALPDQPQEQDLPRPLETAREVEAGSGVSEVPVLEAVPEPEVPIHEALIEPPRGDSTLDVPREIAPARIDIAGDASMRLLEQMTDLAQLPRTIDPAPGISAQARNPLAQPGSAAGIEGDLGERGLLYYENPVYPDWARETGIEAEVRFRFWVSSAGHVVRIQAVRKCAYPELESLARQALAQWLFEPLPRGEEKEEWGEVPIIWRLERTEPAQRREP